MSDKVLVTGGFGYVGGRVAQSLDQAGWQVLLASRSERPIPEWLPDSRTVVSSWDSESELESLCQGVDTIVHAAAMNEIDAAKDPAGALHMNGVVTAKLLSAAIKSNVRRFLFFSSAHVYGSPLVGRLDEAVPARPFHPYATSNRAGEDVVLAAQHRGDISAIAIRLSNSFGAPAHPEINRWTLLVNDLCRQAVTDGKLTLRSAGTQRRDFVTLTDVGRAIVHLTQLDADKVGDGLFNLGGAWSPTIFEMSQRIAERCQAVSGVLPTIERPEPTASDVSEPLDYSIERLQSTGFDLKSPVDEEIDATLRLCAGAFSNQR